MNLNGNFTIDVNVRAAHEFVSFSPFIKIIRWQCLSLKFRSNYIIYFDQWHFNRKDLFKVPEEALISYAGMSRNVVFVSCLHR